MEEFEENGNETTAKASNGLSYQGLSRLASGAPAPETPAAGDTPATPKRDAYLDFLDNLQAKQKYARGVELDRDLYEFYNSGDAKDEEKAFAFYDKWTQDRFGVGTTRGDIWTRDRKGFDNAQQYGNALFGLSQRGYAAIASPEYKAWEKACAAGDRAEMMRLAGIDPTVTEREGEAPAYTVGAAGAIVDNRPLVSRQKTDEEIDEELDAHNAKMKSENWLGAFRAMDAAYHFTDEEKELVRASLRSGDGLPKEYEDTYAGIIRGDVSRAAVLNYLIDNGRHVESRWLRDNVVLPFTSVVKSFWQGAKDTFEEASLSRAYTRANYETVRSSSDSAKFYWNDEERAEYKRLLDSGELAREAEARHYANADLAEIAKERVDAQCARRLADEAKPREQYLRERRERLYLEDALSPKAAGDYGWFSRSVSGAISTLPYMAMSATPAGFAWNVAAQFQDVRNDLILRGEDPDKALFFQAFSATAWAAIEKVQWGGLFGKELSNLAKKRLLGNVLQKAWGAGKLQGIGTLLKEGGKDVLKKTVKESLEEGMQGGLEGWTREYLRSADLSKAMDAAVGQAASDFVDSLGAMGLVSLASTGAKFSGARHAAVDIDDLVEVAQAKIHALNTYKNTLFDPEKGAPDAQLNKQTAAFAADCQSIMDAHVKDGSGAIAAMDEITAKYALAPKESQVIAEWLDLRQNAIGMAKWANSDAAANFAARELGALPIGNDTTFDVEGLFRLVNPNARVERVQVADTAAPAPETVRHVNADEVDALEAQLAGMKARLDEMPQNAKKRKAERQYAERAKRLARLKNRLAEEEQTAQDAVPTKDVVRVTIPMGDKGETKSFVVETSSAAPDIESRGFAASVSEAMRGAIGEDGVVDGGTLTDEQFAALPIAQKANVAVTENQYLAMSEEDKAAYLEMNSLKEGGDFRILDGEGKVVYNADALVTLKRALNAPSPFMRVGGNSTLAHEYSHAISRFARDLGLVSGEDAKTMSALFGAPRKGVDELWDEEAVGDGFVDFLRGKYDFRRLTEEERRAAMGFFERIWDAIKSVFRLNGMSAPVTQHDRNRREQARETAFEAIQRGDFTGLSQYAGIKFDDDASAPEKKETAKTEEKPQEAKAEEKKTPEETPPPQKETKPEEMSEEKPARETDASVDADRLQEGLDKVSSSPREAEASTPRRVDLKRTIFTPDYSMKVETETLWAPLADLVESTDDRTVQMRDRSRVATDMQVLDKTRKGTFQPLALFPGTKSDDGAPIVGGGLRIVSGHGRKRMLETLAREGRYGEYLDAINEECRKQGIPASPAGMKNPVLVSRITGGLKNHADLARFAERSNRWGGLERSGAEYAESDARAITPALMRLYAPDANGNLLAASNREFMGAFLDAVGATGLTNADGTPTPEAALRVRRALMTALFGDDERVRSMVRNLLEKGDELSTGTLLNALMKSAGRLLALKDGRASYDIVPDVREAALQYIAWRVEARRNPRLTLSDHLAQTDLFSASATPVQQALARLLENGRFGAAIDRYAELAAKQAVDAQTALPGFAPATPLQLLSRAERDTTPKNPDGSPVAPYVTPDPESEQAKTPVQTPPAVQEAPKPAPILEKKKENAAVEAAKAILAPKAKETPFVPVPFVRGTATLPQPGAPAIVNPKTGKPLKTGAYNLLRGAYETAERPTPSAQDKSGRGLGIFNPPKATDAKGRYWGDIFPHFQGNKTEMADRVSQALRVNMTRQERDHYKTVVDYFGGGGCWGLYNALTNFDNADRLVVNEYDPDRLAKIRLFHEVDGKVADIAESLLFREGNMERLVEDMRGSRKTPLTNSPNVLASHAESLFWEEVKDANDRAAFMAFLDCAHTMLSSSDQGKSDPASRTRAYYDIGVRKALDAVRADGKRAKEAADAFKARGGTIDYRAGDAANWPDAPHGDEVVAVFDPPYYRTMGYDGSSVPLDAAGRGWDYKTTAATLRRLVDAGDAIVYTDEAWWLTGGYSADEGAAEQLSLFDDIKPVFAEENDLLLGIINNFDHFDVAGAVDGRQETLGVQHGHKTDERTESGAGGDSAEPARTADGRGTGSHTGAVQPVDAGDAGQNRPTRAPGGSGGRAGGEPTAGERALARAVIADDIARHSISRLYTGSAADYDQPSLRAVGTGVGRQAFGWGLYASKNRAVAENHATREQDRKSMPGEVGANAHVYEQTWFTDRPEGDESRLLEWDEVISAEILARIEKQSDAEGIGQEVRDALRFGNGYEGDNVYDDLRDQVFAGNAKATSEFLARAGIDGMKYPAAPRGWNYISFRDDNMRIDHHWVDGEQRFSVQRVTPEAIYEKGVAKSKNGRYDPRAVLTRVRGGWTKEKILKEVKRGSLFGEDIALKLIAEFDTLDEFKAHMYWHGTGNWLRAKGLVPSVAKGKTWAELNGGGGYGKTYWGISVAKTKRAASTFGDHRNGDTTIYPMVVARNANIVDRPDYADAADVEKDIEKLWNEGVDAVRIGDWDQYSEKELLVLNPNILCNIGNGDYYKYYRLNTDENPLRTKTDEQLQTLFDYAKSYTGAETEEALRRRNEITRFSVQRVTPEEDAAYMDAVRRGDTETAQRMVREAAKRAMPNTQVVGEDGLPRIVYHATDEDFTRFDRTKLGTATEANSGNVDMAKIGFWFNDNDLSGKVATNPAKTKAVFLDLENPARATFDELWDGARDEDADGYIVEDTELGGMSYVALDPAQIKSAEPVTYDDAGRVIPLSERFDPADPDIRHSVRRDPWHSVQYGYAQAAGYSEDAHLSPEDKQATDYALDALIEKHHSGSERFGNDVMLANMYPPDWAERPVVKFALQFVGNDGALRDIRKAFFLRNGWRTNDKEGWLRYNAPAKAAVLEKDYSPKELQEKKNRFQTLLDAEREVAKKRSALQRKLGYPAYKDSEEWSRLSAEEQRLKAERLSPDKKHADAEADYQKSKAEWERSKDAKYEEWRNERVARGNAMLDEVAREHGKKTLGDFIAEDRTQPERHSVRRGRREDAVPALDIATGYLARRLLGGKTITPQQAKDILGNLGFVQENPAEVLRRAQSAADTVRERVKNAGERADSELYRYLSQASMAGRMQEAMDRAITGAAQAADPEIGRRLERAISSKRTRDLEAANGFTAAEMMAELPISLTDAFLSVAEFERTPEEKARLEAERAKRAEEEKTDGKTDEEILAEVDDGEVTDPTPEQVTAFDELMGRARYAEDARKRKEAIDKAARAKAEAGEKAQSEDEGSGMDEDAIGGIPLARIRRIAPVFEDQNLFAAFLVEWTAQKIVQKHPELTNNRDLWKSPVAIRELKQTATHILRRLAADILGSPTGSHARNFADHVINELESDATCRTYKAVRRKIAYVYDAIHTDGLRQSRKELMHRLTDGWREKGQDGKYIVHPGIRQLVGAKGRFSATTEEGRRKIDGRTEMYGRTLLRVLAMSNEELQARDAELREITDINPTATGDAGAKATEEKVREAATERAIIAAYGGLARRLPGEIRDATERILADLQGKRQAFEARREAEKAENDKVKAALVEAMSDTPAPRRTKPKGRAEKYVESFVGNIGLEMRNLIRYCKDGKKRDAAQDVITDTEAALSEATGKYRATKMGHEIAINAALNACYGNAADGVRHLTAEPVPEEVARAVFGQDAAMTPTYGNLLQLYASIVQADYKANAEKHGRLAQLSMIRAALTDADMRFYAFALGWYRDNRAALSDAVEAVTGVPVVSPDPLYVPVRVARPVEGLSADVVAWSPIPRALSLRVPHGWDFDEHANFFRLLDEQAEMHAQTVAYAKLGIRLRDTWASREVQDAARRNVGSDDMMAVTGHMRDVLAQDAARPEDTRILSAINYARAWIARFAISGNLASAMSQPASIPVWANIMLGHEAVGFRRLARYMMHVDADAVRDLVRSDGYRARYLMGWTEDVQNAILHPSKSRIMSTIETAYDKGMALSKYADKGASLWIAQGFYRDARDMFIRRGDADADAKRKAIALTWAAVEASQQTGRSEYLNRLQRGNGAVSKILFQFRTAQLLSNNYLIQAVRDVRAGGDPAAKGRLLRAVAINTIIVPAYLTLVRAAWDAILGEPPPENEDVEVPEQVREFLWNAIDNNTAPLFFVSAIASAGAKPLLGLDTYGASSGMPAVDSTIRIGQHAGRALADASRYIVNLCTADDIADEVTAEKLIADVLRLGRDIAAPVRHAARAYDNYMGD